MDIQNAPHGRAMIVNNGKEDIEKEIGKSNNWTEIVKFTQEELYLTQLIEAYPGKDWVLISSLLKASGFTKSRKQCRDRWLNYINPILDKSPFKEEEINKLFLLYKKYGKSWSNMAMLFENRSENMLKNVFHCYRRRIFLELKERVSEMKEFKGQIILGIYIGLSTPEKLSKLFNVPINEINSLSLESILNALKLKKKLPIQNVLNQTSLQKQESKTQKSSEIDLKFKLIPVYQVLTNPDNNLIKINIAKWKFNRKEELTS